MRPSPLRREVGSFLGRSGDGWVRFVLGCRKQEYRCARRCAYYINGALAGSEGRGKERDRGERGRIV